MHLHQSVRVPVRQGPADFAGRGSPGRAGRPGQQRRNGRAHGGRPDRAGDDHRCRGRGGQRGVPYRGTVLLCGDGVLCGQRLAGQNQERGWPVLTRLSRERKRL